MTLTIAGSAASMVWLATSPSRRIVAVPSATCSVAPSVAAGQPSRSAIIAGSTPMLPSVDAMPQITRSGAALLIAAASTALVRDRVGAVQCVVVDVDAGRGAHLQGSLDRCGGVIGAQRHGDHLDVVAVVGDLQRLLQRVLVQLGQQAVAGGPVDRAVLGERPFAGRVGNVLDQDDDLHSVSSPSLRRVGAILLMSNIRGSGRVAAESLAADEPTIEIIADRRTEQLGLAGLGGERGQFAGENLVLSGRSMLSGPLHVVGGSPISTFSCKHPGEEFIHPLLGVGDHVQGADGGVAYGIRGPVVHGDVVGMPGLSVRGKGQHRVRRTPRRN